MDLTAAPRSFPPVLSLVLATAGLGVLYYATARPALLVIDGVPKQLRTHARRPDELLVELGIALGTNDSLVPDSSTEFNWEGGVLPVVELNHARPVVVVDQGSIEVVDTAETDPANLIDHQLFPGDRLVVNGLAAGSGPPSHIELKRAVPIRLTVDGRERLLHSAASTLGEALWDNGIYLYEGDRLDPLPSTPVDGPIQARLHRSIPVRIRIAEQELSGRSAAETVGGGLNDAGLQLVGLDYTIPDASQPIPGDGRIQLVRVREEVHMEQQPLSFDTLYQPLESLRIDRQQVLQPGAYGVTTNRIRVRSEDGVEVGRTLEGEWVAQEPTPQIIGYGTQIQIQTVATSDGPLDYWRAVDMYATSYSPSRAGVSPDARNFGITASGKRLVKGLVAIDRSLIPFGTLMYVPGYGYAEAADTGSGVKGRWIDLGYEDDNWISWSGNVTVYFLTPVPTSIVYIFP
ncbi:MAG: ubiquitin-like domain-containing protein [Anaerolineales bacterium]